MPVGYSVDLLAGNVAIPATRFPQGVELLKALDRTRPDLKGGFYIDEDGRRVPRWSFVAEDLQELDDLVALLRAIRFIAWLSPDGDLVGVTLEDPPRSMGDEIHFWSALAPIVRAGSSMDWYGEDAAVWRWRFDGTSLRVVPGRLLFDE